MPGALLLGLVDEPDAASSNALAHLFRLMADHDEDPLGRAIASAVSTACSTSVWPPARCSTLALLDFMRVPRPGGENHDVTSL